MSYYESMQDLIGNTPLVKLGHLNLPPGVNIFAKLELYNPAGSVKDRVGRAMLNRAEASGELQPGVTIVMGTAGNTGLGLAFAALNKGYRLIFVVPTKFSQEKQTLMRALGAEIVNTPRAEGMLGAAQKAEEIKASIPRAITFNQFADMSNPEVHYQTTGPEIYWDLSGAVDYLVAGAGSGGTFSGTVRYLKEQNPQIKAVLADPIGSILGGGAEHKDYAIEGIGADFIADTMDMSLIDQAIKVPDTEAFSWVHRLAACEGIFAGSSSGAALAAAMQLIKNGAKGNMVVILPDRGDRYFSSHLYE